MPDKETGGRRSIDRAEQLRAHAAKLERISRNTSKPRSVDEELDKAWSEWETTFDAIQDSIMLLDCEFNVVQANAATSRLLGKPLDEIIGKKCCRLVHGTDEPPEGCPLRKAQTTKKRQKAELHIAEKDIWAAVSVDPILDDQGNVTGVVHTIRDITERKKAEESLARERDQLHALMDNMPDSIYFKDASSRFTRINKAQARLLGLSSPDQATGKADSDFFSPEVAENCREDEQNIVQSGQPIIGKIEEVKMADGKRSRWFSATKVPIADENGRITGIVGISRDITERKKAEEALRDHERELSIRNRIANIFLTVPDEQMYAEVLNVILDVMESKYGTFGYFAENGAFVVPAMTREIYWEKCNVPEKNIIFQRGTFGGIWGRAIEQRKTLYSNDGSFNTPKGHISIKNMLITPIIYRDKVISAIHIADKTGGYDEKDQALLETIAEHMAPILDARIDRDRKETERKKAEEALRESEERLELFFSQSLDGFFFMTLDEPVRWDDSVDKSKVMDYVFAHQRITKVNDAMLEQYGAAREQFIGRTPNDLYTHDIAHGKDVWTRFFDAGRLHVETDERKSDGTPIWIEGDYICLYDNEGRITGHFGIQRDITDRRRAEDALRKSEEHYRMLAETMNDGLIQLDENGKYVYVNKRHGEIFGYSQEEMIGRHWTEFHDPDAQELIKKQLANRKKAVAEPYEVATATKDGRRMYVRVSPQAIFDAKGKFKGSLAIVADITERKKAERELLAKQTQLKSLTSELSLAEERERRRIAAGIHDDIGQKLALAKLELQMFMSSASDSKMPAPKGPTPRPPGGTGPASLEGVCATIDNAIEDCHSLTFELSNPALYELSFEAAIEQWLYEQIRKKHGIECEVAVNGDPVEPAEDLKVTLFRAIREAAVNVVKHAKATALSVSIERVGDNVQVSLADNGAGFAPEAAGADLSMDKAGGFGLFNIKERLEHLGGNLKIESAPGRGTTITLTVPLEQQDNKQTKGAEQ